MWSICHRWRCSYELLLFVRAISVSPNSIYGRKANCIMTKDNVWKEMKDSDITFLWFLVSTPKWEGKKFMANSFYQVFLGMITPSESWDILSFVIRGIQMLRYKEAQESTCGFHSPLKWEYRSLSQDPSSWAEDRADLAPSEETSACWSPLLGLSLNIPSPSSLLLKLYVLLKFAVIHLEYISLSNLLGLFWKQVALNLSWVVWVIYLALFFISMW